LGAATVALLGGLVGYEYWRLEGLPSYQNRSLVGPQVSFNRPSSLRESIVDSSVGARQFVLFEPSRGVILARSESLDPIPVASTTKLVTALVVTRLVPDGATPITISQYAGTRPGSFMGIKPGETWTRDDLLRGLMLTSGNDAANALAEYVGAKLLGEEAEADKTIHRFVEEMNSTAKGIGMNQTIFQDPAGYEDTGLSTALDMALATHAASQNPTIATIAAQQSVTVTSAAGRPLLLVNTSTLPSTVLGYQVGKTGFTPAAGFCVTASAIIDGVERIAAVYSTYAYTRESSMEIAKYLLEREIIVPKL